MNLKIFFFNKKLNLVYLLQNNYTDNNIWYLLKTFYLLLLGDFGYYQGLDEGLALDADLFFIILIAVTLITMIVLLNLLIAIISESFNKVMALESQARIYEMYHLNLELRKMISSSAQEIYKEKWQSIYLLKFLRKNQLPEEIQAVNEESDLKHNILELKSFIEEIKSKSDERERKFEEGFSDIKLRFDLLNTKLEQIAKEREKVN